MRKLFVPVLALILIASVAGEVEADMITVVGSDSSLFSTATVVAEFNSQTNTFTFTATNTSQITTPGSTSTITAFGFDLPPIGNASASGLNGFTGNQAPSLSSNFTFSDADLGNVPQGFNSAVLDFGFLTGASGNFSDGVVGDGLLPGESTSFTVSGAGFAGFTEGEIANAIYVGFLNVPLQAGSGGGIDVGVSSTRVPAPEPTSLLLLGTGLLTAGVLRWRQKRP